MLTGKIKQSLVTWIHGRNPGKPKKNHSNGNNPHFKYYPQLKIREDVTVGENTVNKNKVVVQI